MRREDVDDVAADRDLARFLDERHPLVSDSDELCDECVAVEGLSDRDPHRRRAQPTARGNPQRERGGGGDDDRRRLVRPVEAVEYLHPLRDDEGLRREAVEGERVVARELPDPRLVRALAEQAFERLRSGIGGARIGGDIEDGAVAVGADQMARGDALRGAAQAGDSQQRALLAGFAEGSVEGRVAAARCSARAAVAALRAPDTFFFLSLAHTPGSRKTNENDESPDPRLSGGVRAGSSVGAPARVAQRPEASALYSRRNSRRDPGRERSVSTRARVSAAT